MKNRPTELNCEDLLAAFCSLNLQMVFLKIRI